MKRVNVMVSDEAKEVLVRYQREKKFTTLDEALDSFLIEKGKA